MNVILQNLLYQWACILVTAAQDVGLFQLTLVLAIVAGAAIGIGCARSSRMFNTAYRLKLPHYVLCVLGAIITAYSVLSLASLWHCRGLVPDVEREVEALSLTLGSRAIDSAASELKTQLNQKISHIVWTTTGAEICFFLVGLFVPFSIIGWAAYKAIKITT
jgi:hypothetical protein